jgi:hypothetical protein
MTMVEPDIFDALNEEAAVVLLRRLGYTVVAPGALSDPQPRKGRSKRFDVATARAGADSVAYRAGSQKALLLAKYRAAASLPDNSGLTDEEAAKRAGLENTCYWKRCGELREDGLIEWVLDNTGEIRTRLGWSGVDRGICRITEAGKQTLVGVESR